MKFLLDTNVISEWTKPRPDPSVVNWLATVDEASIFLSVISIAEIGRGIEKMDHGARRERLQRWLRWDVRVRFESRTLPVDAEVAEAWGVMVAKASREGITLNPMDAFLAATAQCRGLVIATRNTKDFQKLGLSLFDPWTGVLGRG